MTLSSERRATPQERLRALAGGQASALETLAQMQVGTLERSGLDQETFLLVRLAALVATDAAPVSYRAHLGDAGLPTAEVLGAFVAIAPVVGQRPGAVGRLQAGPGRAHPPRRPTNHPIWMMPAGAPASMVLWCRQQKRGGRR
jgi:4-carboxymuconolactone decarboxylase